MGLSWKNYAEGYPGGSGSGAEAGCYTKSTYGPGRYARKHVPFLSYLKVNPANCERVVNASEFEPDHRAGRMPTYMFYSPNLDNDGHDPILSPETGLQKGAAWLQGFLDPMLSDEDFVAGRSS